MIDIESMNPADLTLPYRRALSDPERGSLRYYLADNHQEHSYVAVLWWWCSYLHRGEICGSIDASLLDTADEETRSVFKTLTSVQPSLMRARHLEIELGIRWTAESVVDALRRRVFKDEIRHAYSFSLLYILLDRHETVATWTDAPVNWSPSEN